MQKQFFKIAGLLLFIFLVSACNHTGIKDDGPTSKMVGNNVYLKVNIWYEYPLKIYSTNYHKGAMLKVGDKFKIIDVTSKKVMFSDKNGVEYAILYNRKHTLVGMNEFVDRMFSKQSVMAAGGAFNKFSSMEQKNIRKGKIVKGMSKAAVVMAYGYPPEHRTPSRKGDVWRYWRNRFISKIATFENGRLVSYD